jgi:TolB-like protein/class 3 adenylate cyclase/Tfp pilus assembly protein PilF
MSSERVERRLAAVLAADVAGYSRLMSRDEEGTLAKLKSFRKALVDPAIAEHRGHIIKTTGDGMLAEFASAVDAARCAIEVQRGMAEQNAGVPPELRLEFRIGIHVGDIIIDENDIFGGGVNIAARLEGIAQSGGVCISDDAHRQIRGKVGIVFDDMGPQVLKNITEPMRAWRMQIGNASTSTFARNVSAGSSQPLALPDKPSIAVLPFQNMSGDPEQEYFADGMVEEIITALSHFKNLFVIARNSSFTYKGRAVDVKQVGRELGVRYVLEGSVRKSAKRVRITGQLIEASSGAHLWAGKCDGELEDIFDLQDKVTSSVVGAIAPKLEQTEMERSRRKPTESLDAYDHYLRGMANLYQFTNREAVDEALRLFQRAIEIDPTFAAAHGSAAWCYAQRKSQGWVTDRARETAEAARLARRAVELSKDDAAVLSSAAWTLALVARDVEAGVDLIDRALVLNPNLAVAWFFGGWLMIWLGKPNVAIERFSRAMRLSPLDPVIAYGQLGTAHAHFFAERYEEASSWARLALWGMPDGPPELRITAASDVMAGRLDQAQRTMARLRQIDPGRSISNLADVLGPYRPEDLARYKEALRSAGLPE